MNKLYRTFCLLGLLGGWGLLAGCSEQCEQVKDEYCAALSADPLGAYPDLEAEITTFCGPINGAAFITETQTRIGAGLEPCND